MMNVRSRVLWLSMIFLCACTNSGVQGTNLYSSFQGLGEILVISPTTLKLSWNLDSKYSEYRIYQDGGASPIKTENFSSTMISGLNPGTLYSFQVTGVSGGNEVLVGASLNATTMNKFTGLTDGGVAVPQDSTTEMNLTWSMNSAITNFKVYYKKKSATWSLDKPTATIKGANTVKLQNLQVGETYCFFVQANYDDGTVEPAASGETALNAIAPCKQLTANMSGLPVVTVGSVVPSEFPWFWTAYGDETFKTEVYELDTDIRVASHTGNGTFRAFVKGAEGTKNYYALVTAPSGQIAKVSPILYSGKAPMTSSKIRAMATTGAHGPLLPSLFNGGNGLQNLGSQVVVGDFNCDGLPDLAISMETATIVPTTTHYSETGAVLIYYSYQSAGPCFDGLDPITCPVTLVTNKAPSMTATYPDPVLVTFKATQDRMHLGHVLQVGNFNGDCYERASGFEKSGNCTKLFYDEANSSHGSNIPANLASVKSCDDLAIGTTDGSFYLVYGDPMQGLVAGSGASTAGQDEFTCDPISNTCRLGHFFVPTSATSTVDYASDATRKSAFGSSMAAGDYNNDGYDELLVRANPPGAAPSDILVYRGSPKGLYPYGAAGSHSKITSGMVTPVTSITSADDFGSALAPFYGSRKCMNNQPTAGLKFRGTYEPPTRAGYELTRCDDAIIGAQMRGTGERGSIFSCKGINSLPADVYTAAVNTGVAGSTVNDTQQIKNWTCAEHYPNVTGSYPLPGSVKHYGASLLGVKNFNAYPISSANLHSNPSDTTKEKPEVTGALFVGAPDSTVTVAGIDQTGAGMVFGYYLGPYVTTVGNSYSLGGIQVALGSGGHNVEAINGVACNRNNTDIVLSTSVGYRCLNQLITPSPAESGENFGRRLGVVPVSSSPTALESTLNYLAVAAPNRKIYRTDGSGVALEGGSVYLYKPDISQFGKEGGVDVQSPIRSAGTTETPAGLTCTSNCTWYSSGVSPYGPSVVYPGNLVSYAHFGLGGMVGASFNGDEVGDLVATARDLDLPSPGNGAAYVFASHAGFAPAENVPTQTVNPNLSLEGNYNFQEAKSVGDLNGDGYDDVVTHIRANGVWSLVIFYGSANGLVKSPAPSRTAAGLQPLAIQLSSDVGFGRAFAPVGDVNGDGFKDIIVFGSQQAYVFFGTSSGLAVSPEPQLSPIGKGPLRFGITSDAKNLAFGNIDSQFNGGAGLKIQAVASADFNNDGYDDIAVHIDDSTIPAAGPMGESNFLSTQAGRVLILYGSVIGPQVNRQTGRIQFTDGANHPVDVVMEDPCTATTPAVCSPQLIGPPHTSVTSKFGFAIAGWRKKIGPTFAQFDRLLISDPGVGDGNVYVYEGGLRGLKPVVVQKLVPEGAPVVTNTPQGFGSMMDMAGDINGDQYDDVIIGTSLTSTPPVYVFYGGIVNNTIAFYGESSLNAGDFWTPAISLNAEFADVMKPRPQILHPTTISSSHLFGWGVTGLGDFNNDGYNDVAVNVLNGDSTLTGTVIGTGSVIIYFGTQNGLKAQGAIVSAYPRCYGGNTPLCEPFQVFLPNAVASENTVIGPDSLGDFNGDGLLDLLVGGIGRDLSVSGQRPATSAGILYPLY